MKKKLPCSFQRFFFATLFIITASFSARSSDSTIFRDDFDRSTLGSFWESAPSWSIVNGSANNFIDGIGGKLRTSEYYNLSSYIIETSASGFTVNYMREFRITFGQTNLSRDSMYVLSYKPYGGGKLTLSLSTDNIYFPKPLDDVIIFPKLNAENWYTFKIARYKSGLIQVYVDKGEGYDAIPLLETIDTTFNTAGHIGWQVDTQTFPENFFVDWITAYKPSVDKEGIREKPTEDSLITQVSAKSGKVYKVAKLATGIKSYTDRNYTITSVPSYLNGASFIQAAMDDKRNVKDSFLTFFVKKDAIVYIGYDPRGTIIPSWLNKWTKTGELIGTNDPRSPYLEVYSRLAEAGEVYPYPISLGGNLARPGSGAQANYIVAAVVRPGILPLQAEDASLSGAVIANDHTGYLGTGFADYKNPSNDYVEWTVKIDVPGTYNLGFTYANGGSEDRPLEIEYDGRSFGILPFSSTLSWTSWSFLSGSNIYFDTGVHKIRAIATGLSGPNIDQLSLYYTSMSAPITAAKKDFQNHKFINNFSDQSEKAYPNPFSKSTTINYIVKEKAKVLLSIHTIQGQQVQLLVNGIMEKGRHQVSFTVGELSSGMYFYRLQIGNEVKVGKLVKE